MIVLVTRKCYVVADKINYVTIHEENEDYVHRGRRCKRRIYNIIIDFEPVSTTSHKRGDGQVVVKIQDDEKKANGLYMDMVQQIREQCPDQLYLDKVIENFLDEASKK